MNTLQLIADAIASRTPITAIYHERRRVFCPHVVGHKNEKPKALMLQTGGDSERGLNADTNKNWRCLFLHEISAVALSPTDSWQTPDNWSCDKQTCVDYVVTSI